jgi:hypothetical protein
VVDSQLDADLKQKPANTSHGKYEKYLLYVSFPLWRANELNAEWKKEAVQLSRPLLAGK